MEKVKKTRVSHLNLDSSKRMIFMSDIHGDIKLFKESLAGVNFSNDDYLFVIVYIFNLDNQCSSKFYENLCLFSVCNTINFKLCVDACIF